MYDLCIIGAGIAGSSLAGYLGKRGFKIALIERSWEEVEGITGELLQPAGVRKLQELALDQVLDDIDAQPIEGYGICFNQEWLQLEYPIPGEEYPDGYGFRYSRLVQNLRELSSKEDNVDFIKGTVTGLVQDLGAVRGVTYVGEDKIVKNLPARLTVVSQGILKSFAKNFNNASIDVEGFMLGIILNNTTLPMENHGHVILANPSPILVYPVGKDKTRVLIDFNKDMPALKGEQLKGYLMEKIYPQLPVEIQKAFAITVVQGAFKTKAACHLSSRPVIDDGLVLIGDNLNMRHPITGGGMTVALTDVKLLSDLLIENAGSNIRHSVIRKYYRERHKYNATINILADALYKVFRHDILKAACFEYLKKGGKYASEPMSILSGISRSRWILFKHFFSIAIYAALNLKKFNGKGNTIKDSMKVIKDATNILVPLVIAEYPRIYKSGKQKYTSKKSTVKGSSYEYKKAKESQAASA